MRPSGYTKRFTYLYDSCAMSPLSNHLTRPFIVRPMEERDLNQISEVEKDAFPTLFPSTSFRRELNNKISHYLVLSRRDDGGHPDPALPPLPYTDGHSDSSRPLLNRVVSGAARRIWRQRNPSWQPGEEFIAGFVGIWNMVDEAHIVSIGVRTEYRGLGLGELLLLSCIEQAIEHELRHVTLEVRVSNHVAQNLYKKYGFTERGIRKGYYTDNREDALIMTTPLIQTENYKTTLRDLISAYESRRAPSERHPTPRFDD